MTKNRNLFFLCLAAAAILLAGLCVSGRNREPAESQATDNLGENVLVVAVYDGDTLKVRFFDGREKRVRLIGVDAPETGHPQIQVKLWAQLSKRFAFTYLFQKKVFLTYDWQHEDKYGRLLAYVWTGKEEMFNELIIEEGFASVLLKFPFKKEYRNRLIGAEKKARQGERGLWKQRPFKAVPVDQVSLHVGQMAAAEFYCSTVRSRGNFVFLNSQERIFSVLIPAERLSFFPDPERYRGRLLTVMGFVEEYRGRPQIVLFFPEQIVQD